MTLLELKELKARKGELSRKIGEAKKAGQPVSELIVQMQEVSQAIKQHNETISVENKGTKHGSEAQLNERSEPARPMFLSSTSRNQDATHSIVRLAEESDSTLWDRYVSAKPTSTLYHQWVFRDVIRKSFGHDSYYFFALDDGGSVVGVLPLVQLKSLLFGNYMVSVPFFNYGSVLAENEMIEAALIQAAEKKAEDLDVSHIEFRGVQSRNTLPEKTEKVAMIRPLPATSEALFNEVGSKVRAQIRKAEQFDFAFRFGGLELLDDFYKVFALNMRDLGTPVYAKAFFENLVGSSAANNFYLGVSYLEQRPVSCCFLMGHRDVLEIPWASTLRSANHANANMFMYWQVLKFAIEKGFSFFDFGRSSKDAGTYRFKKQWGAKPEQLYWHYWLAKGEALPEINPSNPKFQLLIAIWKRMPVWLTKLVGPSLVKNLP